MKVGSIQQAEERYGPIINGKWKNETHWMTSLTIDPVISFHWRNNTTGRPANRIYCNKDMVYPLTEALDKIVEAKLEQELDTFDGCFCIRNVRGADSISAHAYGLAIDINAATNQLGKTPSLSPELVKCFISSGFTWGGNFKRPDGMHFSYCWE